MIDEDDEPRYYDRGERWDRSVLLGIVLFCFFAQKSDFSAVLGCPTFFLLCIGWADTTFIYIL